MRLIIGILLVLVGTGVGAGGHWYYQEHLASQIAQERQEHQAFLAEVYELIEKHYWEHPDDYDLDGLFEAAVGHLANQPMTLSDSGVGGVLQLVDDTIDNIHRDPSQQEKNEFVVELAELVLNNLQPFGRSGVYTEELEEQLSQAVHNIDPDADLYATLGTEAGAQTQDIQEQYEEKREELSQRLQQDEPEAQEQLAELEYAAEVLLDPESREAYDTYGAQPTVRARQVDSQTHYIAINRFSPTTFDELARALSSYQPVHSPNASNLANQTQETTLVIDLRGNLGGAIDALQYIVGMFIGENQLAYEFYRRGGYEPFRTQHPKKPTAEQFTNITVFVDDQTRSTGELLAAIFKKYNLATIVGQTTQGWGTVERVFPLQNQLSDTERYSVFLVHSLTLRDDMLPIEGVGVEPDFGIEDYPNETVRALF